MTAVKRMKLGSQGLEISAQGLGCMGMSVAYGPAKPDTDMIALIHHALRSGITFLDTSDVYGPHTNEILLGKALNGGVREKMELATKFGIYCASDDKWEIHGDPAYVRAACEASLKRLQTECIDLYYQHRIDTSLPIEVTMGELKKLVEVGKMYFRKYLPRFQPENLEQNQTVFELVSEMAARKGCTSGTGCVSHSRDY